jgi:crotonobetainyl-CoA:carnitine CoA-transferase CaiB-like acyl-CoA transferase
VLRRLIATADVVLDNFRPGVMEKIGLSRDELLSIRPDLVSCHITGFGLDGPYRDRPSFDFIAQAMSGFMSVNGAEGEPPARAAPPLSDLIAGAYAAMGVCAALVRRERTGQGEEVAVALTDSMIANLAFLATHYFATGEQPLRTTRSSRPTACSRPRTDRWRSRRRTTRCTSSCSTCWGFRTCATTPSSGPTRTASNGAPRSTRS